MQILHTRSSDGTRLRLARWNEDGDKDILLVHGLAEHLGRYQHIGEYFASQGWRVTFLELRGHGESEGKRGHVRLWINYVEDVQAAMGTVGRPMVIVAHSMGGLVTLATMQHSMTPKVHCVALSNPLLGLFTDPPKLKVLGGRLLSKIVPTLALSNEQNPEHMSRDAEVVRAYANDPLVFDKITTRWGAEMLKKMQDINDHAASFSLPLLMMIGGCDQVCSPDSARAFVNNYGGTAQTKEYHQCYHELFNEPEKYEIMADLNNWLTQQWPEQTPSS
ncbi:MAG: hypothetical protein CMK59_14650 [Proteobacteria bacterium]|nr:hypothetical protein [Pseudomonadota bacterium]